MFRKSVTFHPRKSVTLLLPIRRKSVTLLLPIRLCLLGFRKFL